MRIFHIKHWNSDAPRGNEREKKETEKRERKEKGNGKKKKEKEEKQERKENNVRVTNRRTNRLHGKEHINNREKKLT